MLAGLRKYRVVHPATAFTAQNDLWEVNGHATRVSWICGWTIGQHTELADAQEEKLLLQWISGYTTSGNGTSRTPRPSGADAAYGGTVESLGTTLATGGSPVTEWEDTWEVRAGEKWILDPMSWLLVPAAARWVLRITGSGGAGLADSVTAGSNLFLAEAG
jgi:hypothetical protein